MAPTNSRRRVSDSVVLRDLERERPGAVRLARREVERVFECPRMEKVARWANGASFRVTVNGRVYCCRGDAVTTFYREIPKGKGSVGRSHPRRRSGTAVRIQIGDMKATLARTIGARSPIRKVNRSEPRAVAVS